MKTNIEKLTMPNKWKDLNLKVALFIVATFAACAVRFTVSYSDLDGDAQTKIWLGVSLLAGIAGGIIYRKSFPVAGLIATAGFVVAILARIVFDLIFIDPTSHNLLPFELVMWSVMAFIPVLAGAFLSSMILRLLNKKGST